MAAKSKNGKARKNDRHKARYDLIPPDALRQVAKAFTTGAVKYGDHNWTKGLGWDRVYAAAMRHIEAHRLGEAADPDSGLPHLAHAVASLLILLHYGERYKPHDWMDGGN